MNLKKKQRGFLLNPFRFSTSKDDPFWDQVVLLCPFMASIADVSLQANVITTYGESAISSEQAKFGDGSLHLDGNGDYLSIPHSPLLNITASDFTMDGWVYFPHNSPGGQIINKDGVSGASYPQYEIQISSGRLRAFLGNGTGPSPSGTSIPSNLSMPRESWVFFAFERFGNILNLYQDGELVGTSPMSLVLDGGKPLLIGCQADRDSFFNGFLQDIRITRAARYKGVAFSVPAAPFPVG